MIDLNGNFLLVARYQTGAWLWTSDGSNTGTKPLMNPQDLRLALDPEIFTMGNVAYFHANDNAIWKTDGSSAGTMALQTWPGLSRIGHFRYMQGKLFFFVTINNADSCELWQSDGTEAGTQRVKVIFTGAANAFVDEPVSVGNFIYFRVGTQLWRSDGTEAGTQALLTLVSGDGNLGGHMGVLYYRGTIDVTPPGSQGTSEAHTALLRLLPNSTTPEVVYDFGQNNPSFPSSPNYMLSAGSRLFFQWGNAIWSTNGTTTEPVKTSGGAQIYKPDNINVLNDKERYVIGSGSLFLGATRNLSVYPVILDLWAIDTNTGIARMVHETVADGQAPELLTMLGDTLLFSSRQTLWKSDGSTAGTEQFYSPTAEQGLYENSAAFVQPNRAVLGDRIIFTVANGLMRELWVSDGTGAGTIKLFAETSKFYSIRLMSWHRAIYFEAFDTPNKGLWRTDGTQVGTVPVKKFDAATSFYGLVRTNTSLYFFAGLSGAMQLWKSDGTEAGTLATVNLPS